MPMSGQVGSCLFVFEVFCVFLQLQIHVLSVMVSVY